MSTYACRCGAGFRWVSNSGEEEEEGGGGGLGRRVRG